MYQHPKATISKITLNVIKWTLEGENHIRTYFLPMFFTVKQTKEEIQRYRQNCFYEHVEAAIKHPIDCPYSPVRKGTPVRFIEPLNRVVKPEARDGWSFSHYDRQPHDRSKWAIYSYRVNEDGTVSYRSSAVECTFLENMVLSPKV